MIQDYGKLQKLENRYPDLGTPTLSWYLAIDRI